MELVYLVNGSEGGGGGGGGGASGYPFVKPSVTGGKAWLEGRSVNLITLDTSAKTKLVIPERTDGVARDFIVRLVITADEVPQVTFAPRVGETVSFEEAEDESFHCVAGVNVFAFTETADGVFVVNRKAVSLTVTVEFDANGGTVPTPTQDYTLGHTYKALPTAQMDGFEFIGWYTEEGVEVAASDTVKSSVTRLVARWDDYVDKYASAISLTDGLIFTSDGAAGWTIDRDVDGHGECARSGVVGDGQKSSLRTTVDGVGTLSFSWRTSSEQNCDRLWTYIDGGIYGNVSGETGWAERTISIPTAGRHKVEWRYQKDASISKGGDCAWIDDVSWTPAEGGS